MPITSIAFFHAKPGQEAALGALLTQLGDSAADAGGCLDCAVHQSPDSPELWFVYETWCSEEALEQSFDSERMRGFVREAAPLLRCDMQLGLFKRVRGERDAGRPAKKRAVAPMAWSPSEPCLA